MMSIGAVTNTITAAEVLSLAQAGVIDLDAPASTYLAHPLLHRNPTVRQLLSHTSGIPEYLQTPALSDAIIADPTRSWTPKEALAYATGPTDRPGAGAAELLELELPAARHAHRERHRPGLRRSRSPGRPGRGRFPVRDPRRRGPHPAAGRAGTHRHRHHRRRPLPAQPGDRHHLRSRGRNRRRRRRARAVGVPALRRPDTGTSLCHRTVHSGHHRRRVRVGYQNLATRRWRHPCRPRRRHPRLQQHPRRRPRGSGVHRRPCRRRTDTNSITLDILSAAT